MEVSGILPVIKPVGPSSAAVAARLRQLTGIRRMGHSGTLDPGADGMLVMALGLATVLLPYLPSDKTYRAVITLGKTTDTLDAQGRTLEERSVPEIPLQTLETALSRFSGEILQTPPMYSALHHQGRRFYALARQGQTVTPSPRKVHIHHLQLLEFQSPTVTIEVACSSGTYIRTLAADLGEALGCGAHLSRLTRTVCNGFSLDQAMGLDELTARCQDGTWLQRLLTPSDALAHLPAVAVSAGEVSWVFNGRALACGPGRMAPPAAAVRVLDPQGGLLAIARSSGSELKLERVLGRNPETACA